MAGTGGQGLEALRTGAFDCMILDLNLPDMTSLDLLRTLARERGRVDLPVIIHTARGRHHRLHPLTGGRRGPVLLSFGAFQPEPPGS